MKIIRRMFGKEKERPGLPVRNEDIRASMTTPAGEDEVTVLIRRVLDDNIAESIRSEAIKRLGELGDKRAIDPLMHIYKTTLTVIRLEALNAAQRIEKGVTKGELQKPPQPCAYRYPDSPERRCKRMADTRVGGDLCDFHFLKRHGAMDNLYLAMRKPDYEVLKADIVQGTKGQLDKNDFDFTGTSFYKFYGQNDYFIDRIFSGDADFSRCHFWDSKFVNCIFKGRANFQHAMFEKYGGEEPFFVKCLFEGPAMFNNIRIVSGGGGFDTVQFLEGADFSGADFNWGNWSYHCISSYENNWQNRNITVVREVSSSKALVFDGAKGLWGISTSSRQVTDAISHAAFSQMPARLPDRDYRELDAGLEDLVALLKEREPSSEEEAVEIHKIRCAQSRMQVPFRRCDALTLMKRVRDCFGGPQFYSFRVEFMAPRTLGFMGIQKDYFDRVEVLRGAEETFFAFGPLDF